MLPASAFAWGGAGLFAVVLGWFVVAYFLLWPTLTAPPGSTVPRAIWNVALFSAFAAHHSIFARDRVRVAVARAWPGHERSVFVWAASAAFLIVCVGWQGLPG